MELREVTVQAEHYSSWDEFPYEDELALLQQAKEMKESVAAPNTQFQVGAALRTSRGEIFDGANVETGIGMTHAEDGTIHNGIVQVRKEFGREATLDIEKIAIFGGSLDEELDKLTAPTVPCGGCAQIILDNAADPEKVIIIAGNTKGEILRIIGARNLLPFAYKLERHQHEH